MGVAFTMEVQSRRLRTAALRGDMYTAREARTAGGAVTFVPQDDPDGKSTLHVAAEGNNFEMVAWLLKEGANADLLDAMGRTCAARRLCRRYRECCSCLCSRWSCAGYLRCRRELDGIAFRIRLQPRSVCAVTVGRWRKSKHRR